MLKLFEVVGFKWFSILLVEVYHPVKNAMKYFLV